MSVRGHDRLQPHLGQLVHGPRCQTVTAGLFAGEIFLFDQTDRPTGPCQPVGAGGATGTGAHDDYVEDDRRGN